MISQTLSLLASMYDAVGPGLFLAALLPVFLLAGVHLVRTLLRRPQTNA